VPDLLARKPPLDIKDLAVDGRDVIKALVDARVKPEAFAPARRSSAFSDSCAIG
jgi:hypothetical protein